ncbi:MAG: response regulator [Candidatus Buchananbacteria bacterium]|jgi:CheY-like chemotaxis protein
MSENKCKIALIEDEKDLAEIYSMRLVMDGIETVVINDSAKAIDVLKQETPDLVLLDVMMPEIDGFELFVKIRKDKDLKKIKVYIWSNLTQKKDQEKAQKLGVNGYLIKSDYTPATLAQKVKEILKNK